MVPEIEISVTINYKGAKASVATIEDATRFIRQDLDAYGVPHPKKTNIRVVWPGTVRFYWLAVPNSIIHKKVMTLEPRYNPGRNRALMDQLSIERLEVRESEPRGNPQLPISPGQYNGTPDAGLFAVPMNATASGHERARSNSFSSFHSQSRPAGDTKQTTPSGAKMSWDRPTPESATAVKIKAEPMDVPIPPPYHGTRIDLTEDMDIDSPPQHKSEALQRNRYHTTSDLGPAKSREANALRRKLWDVRRQLATEIREERKLVAALRELDPTDVTINPFEERDFEYATKARVQQLEQDLQDERVMRRKAEAFVQDVRRECKAPFVVPALLDAFAEISQLSSEALEER